MPAPSRSLARALETMTHAPPRHERRRTPRANRVLQSLVADLVAARSAAGMTQHEVAMRMGTTKSAISRLESGRFSHPTLATIEKYAHAVDARLEIRICSHR